MTRAAAVLAVSLASLAHAAPQAATRIEARLVVRGGAAAVVGTVRFTFANPTPDPLDRAYVWLYPNRFARPPAALDDVTQYWVYPERFSRGEIAVSGVRVGGTAAEARTVPHALAGPGTLLEVPVALAPGESTTLDMAFATRLPERYGTLGFVGAGVELVAFHPMLAAIDEAGWDTAGPPASSTFDGTLAIPVGLSCVAGDGVAQGLLTLHTETAAPVLPVLCAPAWHERRVVAAGVTIVFEGRSPPPPADDAAGQVMPYTQEDRGGMTLAAAARAVELLRDVGAPLPKRLTLVEAPLRLELAVAFPGVVLVSDRLWELFPLARARKFHEREVVRALYTAYLWDRLAGLPTEAARSEAAEAGAAYLADLYTLGRWHRAELAQHVLAPVSFVPAVDELLYAPQVAFASAYFGGVADSDRFRDDPRRFASLRARGGVLYEKLRDRLSAEALGDAMRAVIVDGKSLRGAAEAAAGAPLGPFFRQWRGRYPRVNYRLARGQSGGNVTVGVVKETPPGQEPPVEPVEVRVVDGAGRPHDLVWDGEGDRAELASFPAVRSIQLDPRGRLAETLPDEDARFDDRSPHPLKVVYSGFGALLSVTDLSLGLSADFSVRRVRDTRNGVRLQLFASDAVTVGGTISYHRSFGPLVTPLRRVRTLGVALGLARLDADFGLAPSAGTRLSLSVGYSSDDRLFLFEPQRARGLSLGARYVVTRFDDGGELLQTITPSAELVRIITPIAGHTLVADLEGAAVFGDIVSRPQLLAGGGPTGLRGYTSSELFGRARLLGHLEWRGVLAHDLDWNLGFWAFLHGLGAAAFVDAGWVSGCDGADDLFAPRSFFASAGVGLRAFYDNFGVQPGMLAIDLATPLVHRTRRCFGEDEPIGGSAPFMVYVTFLPPF